MHSPVNHVLTASTFDNAQKIAFLRYRSDMSGVSGHKWYVNQKLYLQSEFANFSAQQSLTWLTPLTELVYMGFFQIINP